MDTLYQGPSLLPAKISEVSDAKHKLGESILILQIKLFCKSGYEEDIY